MPPRRPRRSAAHPTPARSPPACGANSPSPSTAPKRSPSSTRSTPRESFPPPSSPSSKATSGPTHRGLSRSRSASSWSSSASPSSRRKRACLRPTAAPTRLVPTTSPPRHRSSQAPASPPEPDPAMVPPVWMAEPAIDLRGDIAARPQAGSTQTRGYIAGSLTPISRPASGNDQVDAMSDEPEAKDQAPYDDHLVLVGVDPRPDSAQKRPALGRPDGSVDLHGQVGR